MIDFKTLLLAKSVCGGGSGLPTGGAPYQQLVTDADGNAKWVKPTVEIYIYSDGSMWVEMDDNIKYFNADSLLYLGYSIILSDDTNLVIMPCVCACSTGNGYYVLTFLSQTESSFSIRKFKLTGSLIGLNDGSSTFKEITQSPS